MFGSLKPGFWGKSSADEKGTLRGDATLSMLSVDILFTFYFEDICDRFNIKFELLSHSLNVKRKL